MGRRRPALVGRVEQFCQTTKPPPVLTVSQWADRERYNSPEAAAEPGRWRTSRAEYQREIMDTCGDRDHPVVCILKAAQVGETEILNNVLGYHVDNDPCPILVIQPSLDMANVWSRDRLAPMIRDTPTLRRKVADPKGRKHGEQHASETFLGGRLAVIAERAGWSRLEADPGDFCGRGRYPFRYRQGPKAIRLRLPASALSRSGIARSSWQARRRSRISRRSSASTTEVTNGAISCPAMLAARGSIWSGGTCDGTKTAKARTSPDGALCV